MPQTRPGNNNHYTNKKSPEERFQSLPDCCKNLVWLYLIGFKTENRLGFNTELYKGTVADRADNPGTRRHATRYREIFGELPVEFNTDSKFRKRAQTAYTIAEKFSEKGMLLICCWLLCFLFIGTDYTLDFDRYSTIYHSSPVDCAKSCAELSIV